MAVGMSFFALLPMLLMNILSGGGSNDLLDYLASDAYWKSKGVQVSVETMTAELKPATPAGDITKLIEELGSVDFKVREATQARIAAMGPGVVPQLEKATASADAEIASRAKDLIALFKGGAKAGAVRRLMAIRTLGELKDKSAAPTLTPLLKSTEMFEADYAAAALAAIDGKPYSRPPIDVKARAADLNVLPDKLGLVGQVAPLQHSGPAPSIDELLRVMDGPDMSAEQMKEQMTQGIITAAEMIGNVRLEGVTVGLSEDVNEQSGFGVVVVRGQYDREAVLAAISKLLADEAAHMPPEAAASVELIDGISALKVPGDGPEVLFLDDQRVIVVGAPNQDDKQITKERVMPSIKAGKGRIAQDEKMTALLKNVDTTQPLWLAARINDNYRQVPLLAAFDALTLTAEPHEKDVDVRLTASGADPAKIKAAVDEANGHLAAAVKSMEKVMARVPANTPAALKKGVENIYASLKGIKLEAQGAQVTGVATIKDGQGGMFVPAGMLLSRMAVQEMLENAWGQGGPAENATTEPVTMPAPVPAP